MADRSADWVAQAERDLDSSRFDDQQLREEPSRPPAGWRSAGARWGRIA